jgi:hypothetical protein
MRSAIRQKLESVHGETKASQAEAGGSPAPNLPEGAMYYRRNKDLEFSVDLAMQGRTRLRKAQLMAKFGVPFDVAYRILVIGKVRK